MLTYENREKIFNTFGILITILCIFQGWDLIFNFAQMAVIVLARMVFLRKEELVESFSLLILLHIGRLYQHHYIVIHYFNYFLLLFFIVFLIYNIYIRSSSKKLSQSIIIILGVTMLLSINTYNSNNRLFKDPQLHKTVSEKYKLQSLGKKSDLKEVDSRLEEIRNLEIDNKWSIKTLKGIENLSGLRELSIYKQDKLLDFTSLGELNNLEVLFISRANDSFNINNLPKLNQLRRMYISLGENQSITDEIIDLKNFPNLISFSFTSTYKDNPITIDISQAPNLESINILGNVKEIIGIEEAKSLKEVRIYPDERNYLEVVRKLRPEISTR